MAAEQHSIAIYTALAAKPGGDSRTNTILAEEHADLGCIYAVMPHPRWAEAAAAYEKARGYYVAQSKKAPLTSAQVKRLDEIEQQMKRCRARAGR